MAELVPWRDRRPAPRALLIAAAASAALSALAIVTVDRPLAKLLAGYEPSAFWGRAMEVLEWALGLPVFRFFPSVLLVAIMLATVAVPRWRPHAPAWMFVAGTHVFSRFFVGHLKDATGRLRPGEWLKQGGTGDTFLWEGGVAFPSGHVSLFASIAIPLAVVAPRTRPLLAVVGFVMLARIAVHAHWASDTIASITLVTLVAWGLGMVARPCRGGAAPAKTA